MENLGQNLAIFIFFHILNTQKNFVPQKKNFVTNFLRVKNFDPQKKEQKGTTFFLGEKFFVFGTKSFINNQ